MKLSDFKAEKAIEVIADILEPATMIIGDDGLRELRKNHATNMEIALFILREHPTEILEVYEPLMQESKEEATIPKLIRLILDILGDPDLMSLFQQQGQIEALIPSGSATENTEDGLK